MPDDVLIKPDDSTSFCSLAESAEVLLPIDRPLISVAFRPLSRIHILRPIFCFTLQSKTLKKYVRIPEVKTRHFKI